MSVRLPLVCVLLKKQRRGGENELKNKEKKDKVIRGVPSGLPRTLTPCLDGSPLHTTRTAVNACHPLEASPLLFQIWVFPWRTKMRACSHRACCRMMCTSATWSGLHKCTRRRGMPPDSLWEQSFADCQQSSVFSECVQSWHERVALLPTLSLQNLVRHSRTIVPPISGRGPIELPDERESGSTTFHFQQSHDIAPRDMRSKAIIPSRDNRVVFASRSVSARAMCATHTFTSRLGGQWELERRRGTFHCRTQLLRDSACD